MAWVSQGESLSMARREGDQCRREGRVSQTCHGLRSWNFSFILAGGKEIKKVKKPRHREKKANRGVGLVTFLCCPLAEIAPNTSGKKVLQIYLQSSLAWIIYLFAAPWALITSSTLLTSASSWSLRSILIWVVGNSSSTCKSFLRYYTYLVIGLWLMRTNWSWNTRSRVDSRRASDPTFRSE